MLDSAGEQTPRSASLTPLSLSRSRREQQPSTSPCRGHTHIVGEGIGSDPHNGLPQHLSLVVNAFDGQEDLGGGRGQHGENQGDSRGRSRQGPTLWPWAHLAQGPGSDDIVQELHSEPAAQLNGLHMALARPGKGGEEEAHGQGVIQVPQSVYERGVPAWPEGEHTFQAQSGVPLDAPIPRPDQSWAVPRGLVIPASPQPCEEPQTLNMPT